MHPRTDNFPADASQGWQHVLLLSFLAILCLESQNFTQQEADIENQTFAGVSLSLFILFIYFLIFNSTVFYLGIFIFIFFWKLPYFVNSYGHGQILGDFNFAWMKSVSRMVVVAFRAGKWLYHNCSEKKVRHNLYGPTSGTFQSKNTWSIIANFRWVLARSAFVKNM